MENSFAAEWRYKKKKAEARKLYLEIGRTWCPILSAYVNFNRVGFGHLVRKGTKPRAVNDQMRRFRLLKYAKSIIGSEHSFLVQRDEDGISGNHTKFWAIAQRVGSRDIVVVIRQTKMGQKHFFSIYDQKTAQ